MYFKILGIWPNLEELLLGVEEKAAPGPSTMPCGRHIMPCREDEKSNSIFEDGKDYFVIINFAVLCKVKMLQNRRILLSS